jgi:hypothetical protein
MISVNDNRASFFLATVYPDGKPAECQVGIGENPNPNDPNDSSAEQVNLQFLGKTKTNRFGVAKVSDLPLLNQNGSHRLVFDVHDKKGIHVPVEETFWSYANDSIQVNTDKAIYKAGDSIIAAIRAPQILSGSIAVDLSRNYAVLWSGQVKIRNHRGFVVIPYIPEFKERLSISAYSLEADIANRYSIPSGRRDVLFPAPSALKVRISSDRSSYKPGDEANTEINVIAPSGARAISALGAVIVDKAVEERIRTDQEFGSGHFGFWDWQWWYPSGAIGEITLKNLYELDMSEPLPEGMDMVAELLLFSGDQYLRTEIEGYNYHPETCALFSRKMKSQLEPVRKALLDENAKDWKFATDNKESVEVLQRAGINIKDVTDPWNSPYRFTYDAEYRCRAIIILSAGPDKRFDTSDDIEADRIYWEYFKPYGKLINQTVKETYASSGTYIRDFKALNAALLLRGLDFNSLRDPWGNPYQLDFSVYGPVYQIRVQSLRLPDKITWYEIWTSSIDYFEQSRRLIDKALYEYFRSTSLFPGNDTTFDSAMANSGIKFRTLVDPWGNPYFVKYSYESEYGRTINISYKPDARNQDSSVVTRKLARIRIMSTGLDAHPNTEDDFEVASYSQDISEQSGKDLSPMRVSVEPLSDFSGAIKGVVTDQTNAVLSGATILAKHSHTGQEFTITSGNDGSYIVRNIPAGIYDVSYSLSGFKTTVVREVPVHSRSITTVNVILLVASLSQQVEVNVVSENLLLESSSSTGEVAHTAVNIAQVREEMFTPRLRDYFPETLYWAPSIITDKAGHARIKFKLADNITTWKMTVLASTKTGEIGVAEKEIEAFQPFFLDHDPPKVLTVGDSIDLPVIVRNYLPQAQKLNIEMKPASWFELQKPGKQSISVEAGESKPVVFPFKAIATVKTGKQQVYAANRSTGDAIEKTIRVHPDGLEQDSTVTGILGSDDVLKLQIPGDVIAGSLNARIKVYPNLIAHITEGIEAGLMRPYGCGEQTISSTYPSAMLLKYYKASGKTNAPLKNKAERYLKIGYQRLLNYRDASGGFGYWGHGEPNIALTAYAIRFLYDASEFTDIDPDLIGNALKWLVSQQDKDGSWHPSYGYDHGNLTAYVARTLAQAEKRGNDQSTAQLHESVTRSLANLSDPHRNIEEPYALAEFAMATAESGDKKKAAAVLEKLSKFAAQERSGFYWALKDNTPFYGWGHAGHIESTAKAVLALSSFGDGSAETRRLIDGGTLWLLQQKDRYGVWYSSQATITVLSAILSRIGAAGTAAIDAQVAIFVNDRLIELNPSSLQSDAPAILDVSDFVKPGDNTIKVKITGKLPAASIQAVAEYYVPWNGASFRDTTRPGDTEALRLAVQFDKREASAGDRINCSVEAERIGSRGWGMMIAEVGLPPGADVDRSTLEEAINKSGWSLSRYDILPDRLILYLWPRAGGVKVAFSLKPRYGVKARTAPSKLYDYYNPDAQVTLPPEDFIIKPAGAVSQIPGTDPMPHK